MFIDETFFVSEINIPNTDQPAILERVTWFIDKYEPRFLLELLGYPLYKLFAAAMDTPDTADQRYKDILNGAEYTGWDGLLKKWKGLITTDTDDKQSVIANYVYYWYQRAIATQSTGIGEVKFNPDGAMLDNPNQKMAAAWSEITCRVEEFIEFMDVKNSVTPMIYPEFVFQHRYNALETFSHVNVFGL